MGDVAKGVKNFKSGMREEWRRTEGPDLGCRPRPGVAEAGLKRDEPAKSS